MDKLGAYLEAEKRGILPADKLALLNEARSRGLIDQNIPNQDISKPGLFGRIGADLKERGENIDQARVKAETGVQTPSLSAFEATGQMAGGVGDIVGNVIGSVARTARHVVPQSIDDAASAKLKQAAGYIGDSAVGRGFGSAVEKGAELAEQYPRTATALGAAGNIASVIPIAKGTQIAAQTAGQVPGEVLSKTGQGLVKMGDNQIANKKAEFVKELVMPKESKKVLEEQVGRTTQNLWGTKIVEPAALEAATIDEVAKIKGIKKGNSNQLNYNIIDHAKNREAKLLSEKLVDSGVKYDPALFGGKLDQVLTSLKQDPLIVGDAETTATRVVKKMQDLIKQNDNSPAGLLKARKEFDTWAQSKKGSVFDSNDTAFSAAVRGARQATNEFIGEIVPDAAVAESLRKQSLLYNALDNIAPKAADEGKTKLTRLAKSASDTIPIKNPILKGAAQLATLGGLGTAATVAPGLAAGAVGIYGAGKVLNSPALKKGLGITLDKTGKIIRGGKEIAPKLPKELKSEITKLAVKLPSKEAMATLNSLKGMSEVDARKLLEKLKPADMKLLPAPKDADSIIAVDYAGKARPMTATEKATAAAKAKADAEIGLTPDIKRAQVRNARDADFNKARAAERATKEAEIRAMYDELPKPTPTNSAIKDLMDNLQDYADAVGTTVDEIDLDNPIIAALVKAASKRNAK